MLERLFPARIDNVYRGHRLGLWIFGLLVLLRLIMSANSMINTRSVAEGADGIPLESFGAGGAETVIGLFALLASSKLVVGLLGLLALVRYRAMVPLLFLLILIEQGAGRALALLNPVARLEGDSVGLYINLGLLALMLLGLLLSLLGKDADRAAQ